MPRIVMPHEEVRTAGAKFQEQAQLTTAAISTLTNAVMSLDWEGLTQQAFYQRFEQAQKLMKEYTDLLTVINQDLVAIADRFKAADESGSRTA
jgi:WXG100 family type VII secretion target